MYKCLGNLEEVLYNCFVIVCSKHFFISAEWSTAGKGMDAEEKYKLELREEGKMIRAASPYHSCDKGVRDQAYKKCCDTSLPSPLMGGNLSRLAIR